MEPIFLAICLELGVVTNQAGYGPWVAQDMVGVCVVVWEEDLDESDKNFYRNLRQLRFI